MTGAINNDCIVFEDVSKFYGEILGWKQLKSADGALGI